MNLGMFLFLMAGLLVLAIVAVRLAPKIRQGSTKTIRFKKEASMGTQDMDLFLIEHVPAEMRKLEIGGFYASAQVQAELVKAGDELLRKLPGDICKSLSCPVFGNLTALLSEGVNPNELTPERVRAAVAVAEASLSIWVMMFEFDRRINPPYPVTLCEQINMLSVGEEICRVSWVIRRIMRSTWLPLGVATAMWEGVVKMLREGNVSIPGIRAGKPSVKDFVRKE